MSSPWEHADFTKWKADVEQRLTDILTATYSSSDPVGSVKAFLGPDAPDGYALINGQLLSRTKQNRLFQLIGTTYGVGDGSTTYGLPDAGGKTIVGLNLGDPDFDVLGSTGGAKTVTLSGPQLGYTNVGLSPSGDFFGVHSHEGVQPHENMSPFIVFNYIVKL